MRSRFLLPLVIGLAATAFAGCGKPIEPAPLGGSKTPAAAPPAKPTATPSAESKGENGASLQGYAHALTAAPTTAAKAIDLSQLTAAVKQFEVMEGRLPASLDELVTMKYFPALPPAPRGSKINYNAATGDVTIVPVTP